MLIMRLSEALNATMLEASYQSSCCPWQTGPCLSQQALPNQCPGEPLEELANLHNLTIRKPRVTQGGKAHQHDRQTAATSEKLLAPPDEPCEHGPNRSWELFCTEQP